LAKCYFGQWQKWGYLIFIGLPLGYQILLDLPKLTKDDEPKICVRSKKLLLSRFGFESKKYMAFAEMARHIHIATDYYFVE
jgi:hypothetical protein